MVPLKTINVAIGIAFLYLLLTFGASAVVEMFSSLRNWRAQMLHDAIDNMLKKSTLAKASDIYKNPLVVALSRNQAAKSVLDLMEPFGWRFRKSSGTSPSYIPAATFSGAVLETLMNKASPAMVLSPEGAIQSIRELLVAPLPATPKDIPGESTSKLSLPEAAAPLPKALEETASPDKVIGEDALQSILKTTLATQGASVQGVRFALEKWFNDTMDRTSGWYKRRTQSCLLLIGLAIAFGGNVSTIEVARWLWQSDAARQTVVAAASDYVSKHPPSTIAAPSGKSNSRDTAIKTADKTLDALATEMVEVDKQIAALHYPVGWQASYLKVSWTLWLPDYLLGALITAIAISMGSTFWFDAVQNLLKIRGTGPKPSSR